MSFRLTALQRIGCVSFVSLAISACSKSAGPVGPPPPPQPLAAPTATQVIPSIGSAAGGASIQIHGTGFMTGTVFTFDGIKVVGRRDYQVNSSVIFHAEAPEHAPGTVDVVVTNPDGQSHRLEAGYTYAPGDSFDANGSWIGYTDNGTDTGVELEIKDNRLIRATCAYDAYLPFVFAEQPRLEHGEFKLTADNGATLSGRVVADSEMVGAMHFPECNPAPLTWRVGRKKD